MDEEISGAQEAPQEGGVQETPSGQVPDEEFDKERALATIRKLRQYEKQAQQLQRELEQLKRQRADEGKSEIEKLAAQLAEHERRALSAEARIAEVEIKADFIEKAVREGVTDLRLAYLAAQAEGLLGSYDDGVVTEHNFKELRKRYPHLFRPTPSGSADGGAGGGGAAKLNMNDWIRRAARK